MMESLTFCAYPKIPKQPAVAIEQMDDAVQETIDSLLYALETYDIAYIAAPHINRLHAVVGFSQGAHFDQAQILINPTITQQTGEQTVETECLYFPEMKATIKRPLELEVTYLDANNQPAHLKAKGALAADLSYLLDCLQGKLILDHLSSLKRERFLKKYGKQKYHDACGPACTHESH